MSIELNPNHSVFWNEPAKHALVKEKHLHIDYYSVYTIEPVLSMLICDDFDYALKLSERMLENGVAVFENFNDLYNCVQSKTST